MREAVHVLEIERDVFSRLADEPGDSLGHDAALLRQCPAFDQHLQVELLGGETLQGALADLTEAAFVHVLQEPILEVGVAELARVVVA